MFDKSDTIDLRVEEEARYIVTHKCTLRACAAAFGIGKSTVHTDIRKRLRYLDADLYDQVAAIEKHNFEVKHLRGGESTRERYAHRKSAVAGADRDRKETDGVSR